jgi:hypothetical protein
LEAPVNRIKVALQSDNRVNARFSSATKTGLNGSTCSFDKKVIFEKRSPQDFIHTSLPKENH